MTTTARKWTVPVLLVVLSLVPAIAGTSRVVELASHPQVTEANARFVAMPLPVILHVLAVIPFSILGAFQFVPSLRRKGGWHRIAGRVLLPAGFVAALSGLWMAHFYAWPAGDGVAVYVERLLFGAMMLGALVMSLDAIRRRNFLEHGDWMTRAYAIGMGAGTQVLTHLPYFILVGKHPGETARGIMMGAGWVINLMVAEWVIWKRVHRAPPATVSAMRSSVASATTGRAGASAPGYEARLS